MDESKTVNAMTSMIGRGKISIEGAADLARCIVDDHSIPHEALVAFSSLGASGNFPGNSERDLHRWLQRLWNFNLQPYTVYMDLEVTKRSDSFVENVFKTPREINDLILHQFTTIDFMWC